MALRLWCSKRQKTQLCCEPFHVVRTLVQTFIQPISPKPVNSHQNNMVFFYFGVNCPLDCNVHVIMDLNMTFLCLDINIGHNNNEAFGSINNLLTNRINHWSHMLWYLSFSQTSAMWPSRRDPRSHSHSSLCFKLLPSDYRVQGCSSVCQRFD